MPTAAVRVALRVKPLTDDGADCVTHIPNEPQISIGQDRSFTFDSVYTAEATQKDIFDTSVAPLLNDYMDGKNATVLAYGQTGSGKSYSMGMAVDPHIDSKEQGIVPRFVEALFSELSLRKHSCQSTSEQSQQQEEYKYHVHVTFLELYNEDLRDLLVAPLNGSSANEHQQLESTLYIREDMSGNIYCSGIKEEKVESADEVLKLLRKGSQQRTTGITEMNETSSRSHAIFTIVLKQQLGSKKQDNSVNCIHKPTGSAASQLNAHNNGEQLISKFHFVDLAGSERLKRTQAVGDRQKEGISINGGLLALGNVISALGDDSKKRIGQQYVPYRDSKLTRLLQDSLGGNSCTLMLACISPSTLDYAETLNTLKYANRARNIENRVEINREYLEGSSEESQFLRSQNSQLKLQVAMLKKISGSRNQASSRVFESEVTKLKKELRSMKEYARKLLEDLCSARQTANTGIQGLLTKDGLPYPVSSGYNGQQYTEGLEFGSLKLDNSNIDTSSSSEFSDMESYPLLQNLSNRVSFDNELHRVDRNGIKRIESVPSFTISKNCRQKSHRLHSKETISLGFRTVSQKRAPLALRMRSRSWHISKNWKQTRAKADDLVEELSSSDNESMLAQTKEDDCGMHSKDDKTRPLTKEEALPRKLLIDETVLQRPYVDDGNSFKPTLEPSFNTAITAATIAPDAEPSPKKRLEKRFNMTPNIAIYSPDKESMNASNELEALAIPAWSPKAAAPLRKYQSMESLSDQSDGSEIHLQQIKLFTLTLEGTMDDGGEVKKNEGSHLDHGINKNAMKLLHQIEADLLVNKELVNHFEKNEHQYTQMREVYEEKLNELNNRIMNLHQQRNDTIKGATDAETRKPLPSVYNKRRSVQPSAADAVVRPRSVLELQETRLAQDVRLEYESKIKKLNRENQELRKKNTQIAENAQAYHVKAERTIQKLQKEVEVLSQEKKEQSKKLKREKDRVGNAITALEREVQQLKRKVKTVTEVNKWLEEVNEKQNQAYKQRTDELAAANTYTRHLTNLLRKAANEGALFNEVSLAQILDNAKSPSATTRKSSSIGNSIL